MKFQECVTPECQQFDLVDFLKGGCSHRRANDYWVESINLEPKFVGTLCDSYESFQAGDCDGAHTVEMGMGTDTEYAKITNLNQGH